MEKPPIISFIVPVYNVERYLPCCLDAILSDDRAVNNCEIICINDGSRDNSLQVLKNIAKNTITLF